jgi:hypothetical protein
MQNLVGFSYSVDRIARYGSDELAQATDDHVVRRVVRYDDCYVKQKRYDLTA